MKGIYVLVLEVEEDIEVEVGSLGKLTFKKGIYLYVGSAQNNLEKRIKRHLSKDKKFHWHIDYLLANRKVKIVEVLYRELSKEWECKIAKSITGEIVSKFGASDCNCLSHLFKIDKSQIQFLRELRFKNLIIGETRL
ncbi:protein of unknown function DUF123 [Dictyoglomus turgidum DSM 6724]|jgi:Uri superfamily endonuclease|uniref:GIY-YIG domain-containing protein n=1 Tax=Dictyoglomus turgidum (strain DSM 6724 / Z-1310) TaxID=515635 RepID=B8DZK6_DICTD|nr:protein of unknown function DUF123 [Dictyoglomus turgidum DSM 6724]PNV79236.1 MAG: DUF123 domain-containing protein [Dictyoglomus turgidum]HBU31501.1 DUF123 domain-containing protein [Dictyoglomus sp.]